MDLQRPAPVRTRTWVFLALAILGLGIMGLLLAQPAPPDRVLILASHLDDQGKEVGPGMESLLSDCLEVLAGAAVTHAQALPSRDVLILLPANLRVLRFHGERDGTRLALTLEWNTASRLLTEQPWLVDTLSTQPPAQSMAWAIDHWPLAIRHRHLDQLLPKSAERFWHLLEALSIQDDQAAVAHFAATQELAEAEPGCATAWTALGDHLYRSLWVNPNQAGIGLNSRTHHAFEKAVGLVPGYPRAAFLWALMLTDTGSQNLALQVLRNGIQLRPGTPDLYLGIAYAGRTSGLLELARKALVHRGELLGPMDAPSTWFAETTYLYRGDLAAFGRNLAQAEAVHQDAGILFYKGYFALLQGQRSLAHTHLKMGSDPGMAPTPFRDLCRAYLAYLDGRRQDGLQELGEVDEVRGKLRIPDGEWTFKEAEAYSLLGDADRGVDCATRAFVQGFSCAAWFENSPFLAHVREHPRWPTLRRNIRERQAVLSGSFPPSAFEL